MTAKPNTMGIEQLDAMIVSLRGYKVMLDTDLAALYNVEIRTLNQATKRSIQRFPKISCFNLHFKKLQTAAFNSDFDRFENESVLKPSFF